jgi:hypothetical protein
VTVHQPDDSFDAANVLAITSLTVKGRQRPRRKQVKPFTVEPGGTGIVLPWYAFLLKMVTALSTGI